MPSDFTTCFIHADLDAFFASVEQLDHPEYRGKPLIVGGLPGERRSVVSTASYEARKYGVHSAMPTASAYKLCPQGIFVHGRMQRYQELSAKIIDIFREFSPDVEQMSVDEAFIDLTGTQKLFGDPEHTAVRIKERVKSETGLTVSTGLAPCRYIAKIASEIKKPDGFFAVHPGEEEAFMLSIPLSKIWGLGDKTQSKLENAGIHTAEDIHRRSRAFLSVLIGDSASEFLYNAVRGKDSGIFTKEAQSHSISAETTFPFDLNDTYTAETAVLELSQTVMFRLLRENMCSRTVVVKLRYGDFTTQTIQETTENDITSSSDLYSRACRLFEKKYEDGRGIRLLGVGAANVEETGKAVRQCELFDSDDKKVQAVEKAIIELEQKHPGVKIHKARLLDSVKTKSVIFALCSLAAVLFSSKKLYAEGTQNTADGAGSIVTETNLPPLPSESPASLFNYAAGSGNAEFLANGYWQGNFSGTGYATFGYGNPFALSAGIPVFKQQVDLSLYFLLNRQWYFEAAFADEFSKNTVALGYYGKGNLKEARIANRGIIFPDTYSAELFGRGIGGGDNQAPGIYAHFEDSVNGRWHADTVLRYDMLAMQSAVFYGKNSVAETHISLSSYMTGRMFVLPSSALVQDISAVYVEDSSGSFRDKTGRTYKKLSSAQYLLLPARCMLVLSKDAGSSRNSSLILPSVAVTFSSSSDITQLATMLGSYGTPALPGTGFLGDIQRQFGKSLPAETRPELSQFSYPLYTQIDGADSVIIQSPAGFSPFMCAYRYDCGTSAAGDVTVAHTATGKTDSLYNAVITSDDTEFVTEDFFSSSRMYADITAASSALTASDAYLSASARYPLSSSFPGTYLGYDTGTDLCLMLRTYTPVTRFDIGTDAAAATVQAYKNGILDTGALYNSEDGTVTLSSGVSETDKIYITWYTDAGSAADGAVAGGAGFSYSFTPSFSADAAFTSRWAVSPYKKYADTGEGKTGFIALSGGVSRKTENTSLSDAASASVENTNTTGTLRVLGFNDSVTGTSYLADNDGVPLPAHFTPVLNTRWGTTAVFPVLQNAYTHHLDTDSLTGVKDSNITGYAIPFSWDFTDSSFSGKTAWSAAAVDLGNAGKTLSSSSSFSIALKTADTQRTGFDVYLQLGVQADDDFSAEDSTLIPTWKISDENAADVTASFSESKSGWQTVTVRLSESDRARCGTYHNARILIVSENTDTAALSASGTIYAGPFKTDIQGMFTSQADTMHVTTAQIADSTVPDKSEFNSGTNYAQTISWKNASEETYTDDSALSITASRYFPETDLSAYSSVNMYFKYTGDSSQTQNIPAAEDSAAFTFTLDTDSETITADGRTAVTVKITHTAFSPFANGVWHKLTVNTDKKTISIDGTELSADRCFISTDTTVIPSRLKIICDTDIAGTMYKTGTLCIDELHLSGNQPYFNLRNRTAASYVKKGNIAVIKNYPVLSDASVSAQSTQTGTIQTRSGAQNTQIITADGTAGITAAGIKLSADASLSSDDSSILTGAGHSAQTATPLAGVFSFTELYRFSSADETLKKNNSAAIDMHIIHIPLTLAASAQSALTAWSRTQNTDASALLSLALQKWKTSLSAKTSVYQKILPSADVPEADTGNYFGGWKDSTQLAFSSGMSEASVRTNTTGAELTASVPFARLTPLFSFTAGGTYKAEAAASFTDTEQFITVIPFSLLKNSFTLKWTKTGGGTQPCGSGGNYYSDYSLLGSALQSHTWYTQTAPFYDLFSGNLKDSVLTNASSSGGFDTLYYSSLYSATWKHTGTVTKAWIPATITLAVSRDIRAGESVSDLYQYKGISSYSAFNLFTPKTGIQDEYTASFTGAVKVPADTPSDYSVLISSYIQTNFYITETGILKTAVEGTFETERDWSTEGTVVYKRRTETSPVLSLVKHFVKKTDSTSVTRNDTMNITVSRADSILKQEYAISHNADIQITKYITLTTGLSASYTDTQDSLKTLSLTGTIGGKVQF